MNLNMNSPVLVKVNVAGLSQTVKFTYLGTVIRSEGGTEEDIRNRFGKAMSNVWRSTLFGTNTNLKLYQSCVVSTILYGSEYWRMTRTDLTKLHFFRNYMSSQNS